jgi:hypothetical protein
LLLAAEILPAEFRCVSKASFRQRNAAVDAVNAGTSHRNLLGDRQTSSFWVEQFAK